MIFFDVQAGERLADDRRHGHPRVERAERVLQHDLCLSAVPAEAGGRPGTTGPPAIGDRAFGRSVEAEQDAHERRLARARLAHHPRRCALLDVQVDAVERAARGAGPGPRSLAARYRRRMPDATRSGEACRRAHPCASRVMRPLPQIAHGRCAPVAAVPIAESLAEDSLAHGSGPSASSLRARVEQLRGVGVRAVPRSTADLALLDDLTVAHHDDLVDDCRDTSARSWLMNSRAVPSSATSSRSRSSPRPAPSRRGRSSARRRSAAPDGRRAPWRCRRVGVGRPTAGAGRHATARSGSGNPTRAQSSSASAPPPPAVPMARCSRNGSAICLPTRISGLSDVRGLWNTIAICSPRSGDVARGR